MNKLKRWFASMNKNMITGMIVGILITVAVCFGDLAVKSDSYWNYGFFTLAGSYGAITYVVKKRCEKDAENKTD